MTTVPLSRRHFLLAGAATGAAMAAGAPARSQPRELDLVVDGRSAYQIVRPRDASATQLHAAEELQRFVREMTGATLPIVTDEAPLPSFAILLGETRHTAAVLGAPVDLKPLGPDGFLLRTAGPHLAIVASPVRGTLYGVYELLEKHGGCRWYASFHSVIPQRKTWRVPALDEAQVPAFAVREPYWFDMFEGDFAARSRANGNKMALTERHGGKVRFGGGAFVHTFYKYIPPQEFFVAHPEYFSEIDGRRRAENAQLCLTNDDVLRIVTERVLAAIRKDPGGKLYSVSQNDWYGYCTCAKCKALDDAAGSHAGSMIHFVNQVAEAVEKEFPEAWIETLAYQYTRTPPKGVRPRHNVVPRLCTIECDFSKPLKGSPFEQNRRFVTDIEGWSAITDKLFIWDYTTNFHNYIGPFPNFAALQPNARFFRDNHVVGLFEQGAYESRHAEFAELRAWVLAKLLWNPDAKLDALYDDFFTGYYGAAAEPVRTYFEELQALVKEPQVALRIFDTMRGAWLTDAFLERASALWQEAEGRVQDDPKTLYRVRMGAIPVIYARYQRLPEPPLRYALKGDAMELADAPAEYRALGTELLRRVEEGDVHVREYSPYHNAYMTGLRGRMRGYPLTPVAAAGLTAGVVAGLGGAVVRLAPDGKPNLLSPAEGGIEVVDRQSRLSQPDLEPFDVQKQEPGAVTLRRNVRSRYTVERTVRAGDDGLRLEQRFASASMVTQTLAPLCRVALAVPPADALVLRAGGEEHLLAVPADQTYASRYLPASALGAGEWVIGPAAGGPGVRVARPESELQRAILAADTRAGTVQLLAALAPQKLPQGQSVSVALRVQPAETAPVANPPAPGEHRADRVLIEEWELALSRPGEWCEVVADPDAENGFAIKLLGNNFEWNATWHIRPERLEKGARYRARVRLKVVGTDRPGEAFWAGIYDGARRRTCGDVARPTDQVQAGYQWYDLATWTPEDGQYLWAGPGRYPREGGRSAVEAVFVDRYELVAE